MIYYRYYRAQRFAGDFADFGGEIQISDYRLGGDPSWHVANQKRFVAEASRS